MSGRIGLQKQSAHYPFESDYVVGLGKDRNIRVARSNTLEMA